MTNPYDLRACGVCGRVLDYVDDGGWVHTLQDQTKDHSPFPVKLSEVEVIGRCDFCNTDYPAWEVPARDFTTPVGTMSGGSWAACDECALFIRHGNWNGLLHRVVPLAAQRQSIPEDFLHQMLVQLYTRLKKNITGPVRRPDPRKYWTV